MLDEILSEEEEKSPYEASHAADKKGKSKDNDYKGALNEGAYIFKTLCNKKVLTKKQELELTTRIYDNRKKIFSQIIKDKDIYSKVYEDINCSLDVSPDDCSLKTELSDIIYNQDQESKELKTFRKDYLKYHKKKKTDTEWQKKKKAATLRDMIRNAEYRSGYYEKLIESSRQQKPELYKDPELAKALEELKADKEELVYRNTRLVVDNVKSYYPIARHLRFGDFFNEGSIGLMKAVERFEYKRGYRFSTYATWWIRQSITRSFADKENLIRVPVHIYERFNLYEKRASELFMHYGREPTDKEVAKEMKTTPQIVKQLRELTKPHAWSLSHPSPGGDQVLGDTIRDEKSKSTEDKAGTKMAFEQVIKILESKLSEREIYVLKARYGLNSDSYDKTLEEIGQELGLTRERIRQVEAKALRKARYIVTKKLLKFNDLDNNSKYLSILDKSKP